MEYQEVKVMEGVYITDFRGNRGQIEQAVSPSDNPGNSKGVL